MTNYISELLSVSYQQCDIDVINIRIHFFSFEPMDTAARGCNRSGQLRQCTLMVLNFHAHFTNKLSFTGWFPLYREVTPWLFFMTTNVLTFLTMHHQSF